MLTIVIIGIVIALLFDFLNGMNDAANSIATVVSTKLLTPGVAVVWAAFWNFAAVGVFGVHVANTMGKGIVDPAVVNPYLILSALIGAVMWVYFCTHFGLPISVSHALIGGLIGPVLFVFGQGSLYAAGIIKIALFIVLSPLIGMILGFIMMVLSMLVFKKGQPKKVEKSIRMLRLFSSAVLSLGHGGNDAQKTMGIIAILLFSVAGSNSFVAEHLYDPTREFHVPTWLIISCYSVIALGTVTGGWKVIKTLGNGLSKLKPVQGFAVESAGAITLAGTAMLGIPVSTTHTVTGSIIGVGMTKGSSSVKWATAKNIVAAWIFTIPATMLISGAIYYFLHAAFNL